MLSKNEVKDVLKFISDNKDNKSQLAKVIIREYKLQEFREEYIRKLRELVCKNNCATNAKEYEIFGRAIKGCNQISILSDGSVYNAYNYGRKNTNAAWRAGELIDEAIKELEKEREGE